IDFSPGATSGDLTLVADNGAGPSTPSSLPVTVNPLVTTGINISAGTFSYTLYPNPFLHDVNLNILSRATAKISIRITDVKGIDVYASDEYYTNQSIILGTQLKAGVYMVYVGYDNNFRILKMVKME
ncbi:MAG TPA: T9SS type A sorting domain-containing protein, partial [Cytophagaceae bacterium]|nr:T9SS type A sorting domain-containing protein [Cytophagaceae bacterium]